MNCKICNSTFETFRIRNIKKSKKIWGVYSCQKCGCYFVHPMPTDNFLRNWYTKKNKSFNGIKLDSEQRDKVIYPEYFRLTAETIDLNGEGEVLEIGSYSGIYLNRFKKLGYTCRGIELHPKFIAYSKRKYNLNIQRGTLSDMKYLDESFDIIMFHQYLEHENDPFRFLKEVKRILKDNGYICFSVPNVEAGLKLDIPNHLFYFSENSLKILLKKLKFKLVNLATYSNNKGLFVIAEKYGINRKKMNDRIDDSFATIQGKEDSVVSS